MKAWGKKGQGASADASVAGTKVLMYMVEIIFIVFPLAIILGAMAYNYQASFRYMHPDAEREIYVERVISCFGMEDKEISRTYPVIDVTKATKENLRNCFSGNLAKGVRVVLEDKESKQEVVRPMLVHTQELPIHRSSYPVVYSKDGKLKQGILHVEVT